MMKNWRIEADWKLVGSLRSKIEYYLELSKFEKQIGLHWVKTHQHLAPNVGQ
jgi:hypothetical protein